MYTSESIGELTRRLSIFKIINSEIPLTPVRANVFKGKCNMCNNPGESLEVYEDSSIYTCRECGEGGGVIKFRMVNSNCSYPEALDSLAEEIGYKMEVATEEYIANSSRATEDTVQKLREAGIL